MLFLGFEPLPFFRFHLNILNFWIYISKAISGFSVLVFGRISLLVHFILAFLAGIFFQQFIWVGYCNYNHLLYFPHKFQQLPRNCIYVSSVVWQDILFKLLLPPILHANFFSSLNWYFNHFLYCPHKSQQRPRNCTNKYRCLRWYPFWFMSSSHSLQAKKSLLYCLHKSQQGQGITKIVIWGFFLKLFTFFKFKIF